MKTVRTDGTVDQVPNKPKTQHRSIRVSDDKWDTLRKAAEAMGIDRAKAINHFIDWYLREAGAKLPERPSREQVDVARKAVEAARAGEPE